MAEIKAQGFGETDLGSLPGVCDHVPIPLPADRVDVLAEQILDSGVAVRLINADVADMDDPDLDAAEMQRRLRTLVDLAQADRYIHDHACRAVGRAPSPAPSSSRDIATVARTLTAAAEFVNAAGLDLLVEAPTFAAAVRHCRAIRDAVRGTRGVAGRRRAGLQPRRGER